MFVELSGSTALVTGATAGIGRAVAQQLAALGAEVVVHGRNAQRGTDTIDEIAAVGGRARFVAADPVNPDDVRRLAAETGDVDILVNDAGIYQFSSTPDTAPGTSTPWATSTAGRSSPTSPSTTAVSLSTNSLARANVPLRTESPSPAPCS